MKCPRCDVPMDENRDGDEDPHTPMSYTCPECGEVVWDDWEDARLRREGEP